MASQKQTRPQTGSGNRSGPRRGSGQGGNSVQNRAGQADGQNRRTGQNPGGGQSRSGGQSRGSRPTRVATAAASRAAGLDVAAGQQGRSAQAAEYAAATWLQITTLVLSVCGLGLAIYLTYAHLTTAANLACSDHGFINCEAVTTSAESKLFGVFPVSELGLAFYVFMVAVNSPWGWRSRWPAVYWARLGSVIVGMAFVLWLLYAELVVIRNLCLYCTGVHIVTFLLFVLIVFHASGRSARAAAAGLAQMADGRR